MFKAAWALYPRRPGNSRANAERAFRASVKRGADPYLILGGVEAYAAYVTRERIEPRYIKRAETFFGPGRHWESDYGPPTPRMVTLYDDNGLPTPDAARAAGLSA